MSMIHPQSMSRIEALSVSIAYLTASIAAAMMSAHAADWPQFRGPGALGRGDSKGAPLSWSDTSNIVWKAKLPGPGASSPITWGHSIFVTCFTGYATSSREPGDMTQLKRHLLCLSLKDGTVLWNTPVPAELPEQDRIREDHGYASSTPTVDAEHVYTFYGKSGVFAFDHSGKEVWQTKVGDKLNGWGSATSPVLLKDLILVNASTESEALVALDRKTGREVWRSAGIKESWHAPVTVSIAGGKTEVVMAMFRKVVGIDPDTGAQLWHADTGINWYMCPTPVAENGIVYSIGGRNPNGGLAIRAGGRGDISQSHVVWKVNKGSNVPSPILHEGHLYFAHENLSVVYCINARTGEVVYEERLEPSLGQIYASPILADGRIYFIGRGGRGLVIAAKPVFERLAETQLEGNRGSFNASPALSGDRILLRSNTTLYCIGER